MMVLDSSNHQVALTGIVSDHMGGFFLSSRIDVSSNFHEYYIDCLDSLGNSRWGSPLLIDTSHTSGSMYLFESTSGNAFVVTSAEVCAMHWINSVGIFTTQGSSVCPVLDYHLNSIEFSENGKAYIVYQVSDSVFVNCLDSLVGAPWPAPILISSSALSGYGAPTVAITSNGNAVVAWQDTVSLKVQRLDSTGALLWGSSGKNLNNLINPYYGTFDISSNGHNGCFVTGGEYFYNLDASGNDLITPCLYSNNCMSIGFEGDSRIYLTDTDHVLITWTAYSCPDKDGIYAQLMNYSGDTLWPRGGIPFFWAYQGIYTELNHQTVVNDDGSAICIFSPDNLGLYANRVPDSSLINSIDHVSNRELQLFPNPSDGLFKLIPPVNAGIYHVSIFNETGTCVYETKTWGTAAFDFRKSATGVYCVVYEDEWERCVKRIIVH